MPSASAPPSSPVPINATFDIVDPPATIYSGAATNEQKATAERAEPAEENLLGILCVLSGGVDLRRGGPGAVPARQRVSLGRRSRRRRAVRGGGSGTARPCRRFRRRCRRAVRPGV